MIHVKHQALFFSEKVINIKKYSVVYNKFAWHFKGYRRIKTLEHHITLSTQMKFLSNYLLLASVKKPSSRDI